MAADLTSMLATELLALIPSAGSVASIHAVAPTLLSLSRQAVHLGISGPRELLEAGITWLGELPGRTQDDGARVNYSYRDVADALRELYGLDATSAGVEVRYESVARIFGNTTAISGRRIAPRLAANLAAAIVSKLNPGGIHVGELEHQTSERIAKISVGTDFLLERSEDIMALIDLARTSKLLLAESWHEPLCDAFFVRYRGEPNYPLAQVFDRNAYDWEWTDAERLALATILLSSCATRTSALQHQLRDLIASLMQSRQVSRTLPATLTFLRERAALALAHIGDPRPGVSALDVDIAIPDHVFSELPPEASGGRQVFMTIYPVTCSQFRCKQQLPALLREYSSPPSNHPVTCVTAEEAEGYCDWYSTSLASQAWFRFRAPSGEVRARPLTSIWQIGLPTQNEIMAAAQGIGPYPWSGAIEDSVGLARRLSYNRLLPVGLFADELAPGGVYDLSGLIWQWLSEPWPQETGATLSRHRCVYGGGFGKNIKFFRTDTFLGAMENTRRVDRGFRFVLRLNH